MAKFPQNLSSRIKEDTSVSSVHLLHLSLHIVRQLGNGFPLHRRNPAHDTKNPTLLQPACNILPVRNSNHNDVHPLRPHQPRTGSRTHLGTDCNPKPKQHRQTILPPKHKTSLEKRTITTIPCLCLHNA